MNRTVVRVASDDSAFIDFYDALGRALGAAGTVYVPYAEIAHEARMAIPPPTEVVVLLSDPGAVSVLHATARDYLQRDETRSLSIGSAASDESVRAPRDITLEHLRTVLGLEAGV